jgi:hypothetical protein
MIWTAADPIAPVAPYTMTSLVGPTPPART